MEKKLEIQDNIHQTQAALAQIKAQKAVEGDVKTEE